jgi:cell division protein FtsL
MLKKHTYRLILIIIIITSLLGIYKQLSLLLNAQQQVIELNQKVSNLIKRNEALKKSINP